MEKEALEKEKRRHFTWIRDEIVQNEPTDAIAGVVLLGWHLFAKNKEAPISAVPQIATARLPCMLLKMRAGTECVCDVNMNEYLALRDYNEQAQCTFLRPHTP